MPTPADLPATVRSAPGSGGNRLQDILGTRPEKAYLMDLDSGEERKFLINPAQLKESYAPRYARLKVPGLPHERMQWSGGSNTQIPLTVYYDELIFALQKNQGDRKVTDRATKARQTNLPLKGSAEDFRRFLISLQAPRRLGRLVNGAPPPVLFVWPGIITMRMRVTKVDITHQLFEPISAHPRAYVAEIVMEEAPLGRITSQGTFRRGTHRSWASRRA